MNAAQRLHTLARRTCMARFDHWARTYGELAQAGGDRNGFDYTDEAYATFPRYNVLQAVLDGVEALDADALPPLETLRDLLIEAATTASSSLTIPAENPSSRRAMAEEREILAKIFRTVGEPELAEVEPLFFRRVLSPDETQSWRLTIETAWGAGDDYWYPLGHKTHPSLVALDLEDLDQEALQRRMRRFFADNGAERIIELREDGVSYALQADAAELAYTGAEGFWTSVAGDWIVYCSHEGTITFGGVMADELGPEYQAKLWSPHGRSAQ